MKFGSKYDLLDTPAYWNTKIYWNKYLQSVEVNICTINHYLLDAVVCKWLKLKTL